MLWKTRSRGRSWNFEDLLKNYDISGENITVHPERHPNRKVIPPEKDEFFNTEFQRSIRLLTDGKLEEGKIHPG
jgi:hypothetical protein